MVFGTGSNSAKAKLGVEDDIYFHDLNENSVAVYFYDKATMDRLLPEINTLLEDVSWKLTLLESVLWWWCWWGWWWCVCVFVCVGRPASNTGIIKKHTMYNKNFQQKVAKQEMIIAVREIGTNHLTMLQYQHSLATIIFTFYCWNPTAYKCCLMLTLS